MTPQELVHAPIINDLFQLGLSLSNPNGLHMEFGVGSGNTLKKIRKYLDPDIKLYGFDSFKGLPEPWLNFPVGTFKTDYRIKLPNTELVIGLYQDTIPPFIERHPEPVSFMHIDCDLYSSTYTILTNFRDQIKPGAILLFNELFGYTGYENYEYKALIQSGITYEPIARWTTHQALIQTT